MYIGRLIKASIIKQMLKSLGVEMPKLLYKESLRLAEVSKVKYHKNRISINLAPTKGHKGVPSTINAKLRAKDHRKKGL